MLNRMNQYAVLRQADASGVKSNSYYLYSYSRTFYLGYRPKTPLIDDWKLPTRASEPTGPTNGAPDTCQDLPVTASHAFNHHPALPPAPETRRVLDSAPSAIPASARA